MKLIPMEFNADFVAWENPKECGKIDYINEKILFSERDCLDIKAVTNLQKFRVGYSAIVKKHLFRDDEYGPAKYLNILAIKKSNDAWIFICDSKELYLNIAKEFMHAYRLEATITGKYLSETGSYDRVNFTKPKWGEKKYNARRFFDEAVKAYDARREFLKFVLEAGRSEAENSADNEFRDCDRYNGSQLYDYECECRVAGCAFDMPDDNMKYFSPSVEKCIIYENVDIDKLYERFGLLLPEKREITREIEKIKLDYGKDFIKKEEVLKNFKKSVCTKDMLSQAQKVRTEIQEWTDRIENKTVEKSFGEKYIAVLQEKIKILEDLYYNEISQNLKKTDFDTRSKKECKNQLLERLRNIQKSDFNTGVNLYKDYCAKEKQLEEMMKNCPENTGDLMISQYVEFYRLGKILISHRLNQIGNNPAKKRQIPQSEIDCAMVYFYETDTPQEAYNLQREMEYSESKKKGAVGEKEVDYALKWLDKSYMVVPKMKSKKHGQQCIELINSDFIDEVQEYDHIVIGKQGVFVIETKNYAGKLIVDTNGNWIRVQKDGTSKGERNPVQQVDRHTKLLKSFLKEGIPVIGLICIANRKAIIEGRDNCPIPLIKSDLLTWFIESYSSGNRMLSDDEIKECLLLIEKHRYQ